MVHITWAKWTPFHGKKGSTKFKELGPPEDLEQAGFKAETLRHFHGQESSHDLLELLFSDLENTVSNNSTRQWITAILDFLGRAPLKWVEGRLQSMGDRKRCPAPIFI